MKKILFVFAFIIGVCNTSFAQERSVVEPELLQLLNVDSDEKIPITIVLKSHTAPSALKAKAVACRSREMVRAAVVRGLKDYSNAAQASLSAFLEEEEQKGNVANISNLWIANAICCDATTAVINKLQLRDDIVMVGLNKEVQMISNYRDNDLQQVASNSRGSASSHLIQVHAPDVWELGYTGKNVVVAILDSGTNDEHLNLKDHLWLGYADTDGDGEADDLIHGWNFVSGNANIKDDNGHGTHCAGIVCGDGTVGNTTGVAPDATLMTLKTIDRSGGGSPANMIKGVQFAVENGANIISISSGFKQNQIGTSDKEALRRTFESALEAGVIAFVAAGNDGENEDDKYVDVPASCPPPYLHPDQQANSGGLSSVVCVGSVNSSDGYSSFSSQGPVTWQDTEFNDYPLDDTDESHFGLIRPDICAPGEWIYSLKHDDNDIFKFMNGTSQATPCAAGIAALMLEKNSTLTPADICRIMETTAVELSKNKINLTGSGRVDALNAVNAVEAAEGKPYVRVASYAFDIENNYVNLTVANQGNMKCSENTVITLSTNDHSVEIPNATYSLGSIEANGTKQVDFALKLSDDVIYGYSIYIEATITDGAYSWADKIEFRITPSAKLTGSVNAPMVVGAGQSISLNVDVLNNGAVETANGSTLVLTTSSSYVTISNNETTLGALALGETGTGTFSLKVSENAPYSEELQFDLYAVPSMNIVYGFERLLDQFGYLEDGFECWTTFKDNNDKYNHAWWHSSNHLIHRMESAGDNSSGNGHLINEAYCSGAMVDYTYPIDNYLVAPKIKATENSRFTFKARADMNYYAQNAYQHFGVAVSQKGNKDAADFETIKEWDIVKEDGRDWIEFSVDLSQYSGKEIYVAIRNFFAPEDWKEDTGYNAGSLHVDDAEFSNVIDLSPYSTGGYHSSFSLEVGDPVDTAVDEVKSEDVKEVTLYDINGRHVFNVERVERGIYIIDGNKVLVK